jgi:hypothetical protein
LRVRGTGARHWRSLTRPTTQMRLLTHRIASLVQVSFIDPV